MKTRIISILASVAVMLLSGCTHDTMPGGADCEGNRVEFTLAGITPAKGTRATGNNDTAKPTLRPPSLPKKKSLPSSPSPTRNNPRATWASTVPLR